MNNLLYALICLVLLNGLVMAQTFDLQFIEERNDAILGGEFDVRIQIRSVGSTFGMGTSNLVFEYNTAGLTFDSTWTAHNFSGFIPPLTVYAPMALTPPFGNAVSINIVLSLAPGQAVTLTPTWMDVVTIDFTIADAGQTSDCIWRTASPNPTTVYDENSVTIPSNTLSPGDFSLPVELSSFTAGVTSELDVSLQWVTESEINNMGFEVFRSEEEEGTYTLLSSYLSDETLKGYGNSSSKHIYKYTDETVMQDNTYWYKITDVDVNGTRTDHGPISIKVESGTLGEDDPNYIPDEFQLSQNYPNPFNPETKIKIGIPNDQDIGEITVNVFNIMGQKVRILFQGNLEPGIHTIKWDGKDSSGKQVSGGTYFYYLKSNKFHQIKKMILMK
jgi:FlgD Ig-like domain